MYTSNRSRTDSGSSDSSRGSGNSGNSGKSRRRSHRPRGCRGGSNRRKQKNAEGGNKQFFKKTYNSDFKNRVHSKFSNSSVVQINLSDPSEAEFSVNASTKSRGPDGFRGGSYDSNIHRKSCNVILPDYNYNTSGFPGAGPSDFQYGGNMQMRNPQSYYGNLASKYMGESETDYPLLQSTFSESSNETVLEQRDSFASNDGILPPLPSEDLYDTPKEIPSGPNPYALKPSSSGGTMNHNISHVTHSYAAPSPLPPAIVRPVSRPQPNLVETSRPTQSLPGILQQVHNNMDLDYRSHRLEKQRQNVVGGSLFVTSPRSFLMGCKRSFHE
ncbi:unnamed protein product [Pseudo-nitzschia multistriata]|uniref:Uncharacterized protein n=1 Tax=Pseudo-nitzschia multistriata TaxID=183589 RepID=A0A448Z8U4_9STRA|nr:unnamed protein product [Pseudo-nitzschia multistriata]